jgi:hypothetical protein
MIASSDMISSGRDKILLLTEDLCICSLHSGMRLQLDGMIIPKAMDPMKDFIRFRIIKIVLGLLVGIKIYTIFSRLLSRIVPITLI